jgi:hypothetical protein
MSRRAAIILTIILAAIIVAMIIGVVFMVRNARASQIHLIQDGYKGWAKVSYGVDGAPPLPVEEGHRILRYDADGRLETSTEFEEGWSVDNYFYVKGTERQSLRQRPPGFEGQIWGAYTMSASVSRIGGRVVRTGVHIGFFVGTEEEFSANPGHWMPGVGQ